MPVNRIGPNNGLLNRVSPSGSFVELLASLVGNDSLVAGDTVTDALNTLLAGAANPTPIMSEIPEQLVPLGPGEDLLAGSTLTFPYEPDRRILVNAVLYNTTSNINLQDILEHFQLAWDLDGPGQVPFFEPPDFYWEGRAAEGGSSAHPYALQYQTPLMSSIPPQASVDVGILAAVDAGDDVSVLGHIWGILV